MTESQEFLKGVSPPALCVIHVHVGGDGPMAAAVADVLRDDGQSVRAVARLHGVSSSALDRSVRSLRALCLDCCAKFGLDARSMLAVREEDGASRRDAEAQEEAPD